MQLIASGKWSKAENRWQMVVALRRPVVNPFAASRPRAERRPTPAGPASVIRLADRRPQ